MISRVTAGPSTLADEHDRGSGQADIENRERDDQVLDRDFLVVDRFVP